MYEYDYRNRLDELSFFIKTIQTTCQPQLIVPIYGSCLEMILLDGVPRVIVERAVALLKLLAGCLAKVEFQ